MENIMNIAIYKDGNNTIVVFKDTTPNVEDMVRKIVSAVSDKNIEEKEVSSTSSGNASRCSTSFSSTV